MEVRREGDVGKVFDILVEPIDHIRQILGALAKGVGRLEMQAALWYLHLLFKHPHLDPFVEDVTVLGGIFGDDFRDCGSPGYD